PGPSFQPCLHLALLDPVDPKLRDRVHRVTFLVQCFLHAGLRFALVDDLVSRRIVQRSCDRVPPEYVEIELLPAFASHEFLRRREHGATVSFPAERRVDRDLVEPPASRNLQQTTRWRSHPDPAHPPVL